MSLFTRLFGIDTGKGPKEKPTFRENLRAIKNLPRFLKMVYRTHRGLALANVVLRLIKSVTPVAALWVGKLIIDEVVLAVKTGPEASLTQLWTYVGIEFGIALFSDLLTRGIDLCDALLGDLVANETSILLMKHASTLDMSQFEDPEFYDKLERGRQQTTPRVILMSQVLTQAQDVLSMIFLAAGLASFNPWLILLLALAVIPAFLNESYFNQSTYSLSRSWTPERRELDYLRYIGASDETAREVKLFGLSDFLTDRFRVVSRRYFEANKKLSIRRAIWGSVFNALSVGGYYAAYVIILLNTLSGMLSLGELTFLAGAFARLRLLMQGILSRFSNIAQGALYLRDFFEFLSLRPKIISPKTPLPFPEVFREGITFENVGFKYPGSQQWAIRNISFTLKAGEKLALVGENGSGKTTLVKLLGRFYDPDEGRILIDGHDLREYDPVSLRNSIGVIFQDFVKYQFPLSDNIAVGEITQRSNKPLIQEAAHKSLADSVAARLTEGYNQMLGRRFGNGVELSGGEWQKVALARAYMRNAQLIILDEPTAALDARAEYEVFRRFAELTTGKTSVIISHRFSTVRMADRILVLQRGEMKDIGTHEELISRGGLYAELFRLQAQGYL